MNQPELEKEADKLVDLTPLDPTVPFLEGIDLFWTDKEWSLAESDLALLDTSSKSKAVDAVKKVTRGYASIKPISIVNGLEFYTRKDVIQKALDARLRYVPDHVKDWARVKRGKDRIALQEVTDEEGNRKIVFFIEGRDQVYRGLNR